MSTWTRPIPLADEPAPEPTPTMHIPEEALAAGYACYDKFWGDPDDPEDIEAGHQIVDGVLAAAYPHIAAHALLVLLKAASDLIDTDAR